MAVARLPEAVGAKRGRRARNEIEHSCAIELVKHKSPILLLSGLVDGFHEGKVVSLLKYLWF